MNELPVNPHDNAQPQGDPMTSRQWRVLFGAVAAGCSFLLIQPEVTAIPVLAIALGLVNIVVAYLKAPPDLSDPAA